MKIIPKWLIDFSKTYFIRYEIVYSNFDHILHVTDSGSTPQIDDENLVIKNFKGDIELIIHKDSWVSCQLTGVNHDGVFVK